MNSRRLAAIREDADHLPSARSRYWLLTKAAIQVPNGVNVRNLFNFGRSEAPAALAAPAEYLPLCPVNGVLATAGKGALFPVSRV